MAGLEAALEQEARKVRSRRSDLIRRSLQSKTAAILLDSDAFRISKPFDMDKTILLPLRGSLGRKPGRATQAKVRAREKYKKNTKKCKRKEEKKEKNTKKEKIQKLKKKKEEQSSQGRKPATGALAKVRA